MRIRPLRNTDYVQANALLASKAYQDYLAALWYWREPASVCIRYHGQIVGWCLVARGVIQLSAVHPDFAELEEDLRKAALHNS